MRRRQAYAIKQYEKAAELTPELPKDIEKPAKKGYCRYCGVKIGRGVAFHERKCKDSPA